MMHKKTRALPHFLSIFMALILLHLLLSPALLSADSPPTLRGKAFTDPDDLFIISEGWVKKPITHEQGEEKADIVIALEQDVYQTILPLIQGYGKAHGLNIVVKEGTCGIAAGMLSRKSVDMGGFCCPPSKEDRLPGIKYHALGIVSIAFLVHVANPVDNLTAEQLTNLYRGKNYRWSELKASNGQPGPPLTIRAVGRLHCQMRPGHWRLLLDNERLFSPRLVEVGSIPDMLNAVATNREAIGWEVLSMVEKYKAGDKVKPLTINGHAPTDYQALATGNYPYYRTYTITTWEGSRVENEKARQLAEYLISAADTLDPHRFGFASAGLLRKSGWKFKGTDLVGEPR